jgi:hypothetical protein
MKLDVVAKSDWPATTAFILGVNPATPAPVDLPAKFGAVVPTARTPTAYRLPAFSVYVAGKPPTVLRLRWYVVLAVVNKVVSDAVLATNVAVVSLNVYSPMRARVRPAPAVVPDDTVIADTVND